MLGQPGFLITDRIVVGIAFYFYLPPAGRGLAEQLPAVLLLGTLTAWGLSRLVGGVVDSLADPVVGFGSDRSHSRLGRRRSYLIYGVAPMVLAPVALFFPPGPDGSWSNFAWLTVLLAVYYVFFTVYVGPYLALIPELARDVPSRVSLTTQQALVALPVMLLFQPVWLSAVDRGREAGFATGDAVRAVVVVLSVAALGLCLLPIAAVDEKRHARPVPSTLPLGEALRATLRQRAFLIYLAAQISFILGVNMLQPAVPYIAIALLGRDEGFAATLSLATLPTAILGFPLVRVLATRIGAKRTSMVCVGLLGVASAALGGIRPAAAGSPADTWNLGIAIASLALSGLSMVGFFVLPHVLMGQVIDVDERETGANRSAMFYGTQGLLTKWAYQASLAMLSWLFVRFGNSAAEPTGVLLVGPVTAGFCAVSLALYALYPERELLERAQR